MPPKDDKCACGCGAPMTGAVSEDFATEACQRQWHRKQAALPEVGHGDPLDAILDALQGHTARIRAMPPPAPLYYARPNSEWSEIRYTGTGTSLPAEIPYTRVARWWTYDRNSATWALRETGNGPATTLYRVSDEDARDASMAAVIIAFLRRRFDGPIPRLPAQYIP